VGITAGSREVPGRKGTVTRNIHIVLLLLLLLLLYRDTMNVEPETYDCTLWSHWNSNEKLKEKFGSCNRKTFDRFTTKDSCTWNITHNTESTAV